MEAEGSHIGHMVEHSFAMFGALLGLAVGALAFGALAALTIATGGLAGALLIGAAAAGGASLGGTIGKRYGQKAKKPTGPIIVPCSIDVLYEGKPAAHTTSGVMCSGMPGTPVPHPAMLVAEGSATVLINGMMAVRKDSKTTCGASVGEGCGSIIIGGQTAVHPGLTVEPEFPAWLDTTINVLGLIGIIGVFTIGFIPGLIALVGGFVGATLFSWIGGMIFGEGSDGQFWLGLTGGFIGGILAARAALGWRAGLNTADEAANIKNYKTTKMDDHYVGEETGNGWCSPSKVKYLTEAERAKLKLTVKDGKVYDADGNLYDTSDAGTFFSGKGKSIFVMDENGNIYASKYQEVGEFHHSSMLGGKPVAGAGEITVKNGTITEISNKSGHYQPTQKINQQVLQQIDSEGININDIDITGY